MKNAIAYGLLGLGVLGGGAWLVTQGSSPSANIMEEPPSGKTCTYSCSAPDRDCSGFSSHSEAQEFFNCCGFSDTNDPMKLDSVGTGDGIACELLP